MEIKWVITADDIATVEKVLVENENAFLKKRRERNIEKKGLVINRGMIIRTMLICLLTSQQRSGPDTAIGKFFRKHDFTAMYIEISKAADIELFIKKLLLDNNLKRYINRISEFFAHNIRIMQKSNWDIIKELEEVLSIDSKEMERATADRISYKYKGLGPKQSRNFLQSLGVTRYEIPIDSRITKWLNNFGFPVSLNSSSLGDKGYYHFVNDGFIQLCDQAGTYPCLLDAAIFSSYDGGRWNDDNVIF